MRTATGAITGRVVQVTGPVVDVEFPRDQVPDLLNALSLEVDLSGDQPVMQFTVGRS